MIPNCTHEQVTNTNKKRMQVSLVTVRSSSSVSKELINHWELYLYEQRMDFTPPLPQSCCNSINVPL